VLLGHNQAYRLGGASRTKGRGEVADLFVEEDRSHHPPQKFLFWRRKVSVAFITTRGTGVFICAGDGAPVTFTVEHGPRHGPVVAMRAGSRVMVVGCVSATWLQGERISHAARRSGISTHGRARRVVPSMRLRQQSWPAEQKSSFTAIGRRQNYRVRCAGAKFPTRSHGRMVFMARAGVADGDAYAGTGFSFPFDALRGRRQFRPRRAGFSPAKHRS